MDYLQQSITIRNDLQSRNKWLEEQLKLLKATNLRCIRQNLALLKAAND